ncbi:hypothetical protein J1N35_025283 [Gossypium stocksii]|uniref:Reverse transcriptase domain-containing protein n=1 Tax=Gossypium stocksii TaxID=47602 RepID=A0A9D3V695_9ROSI|nr:hypothetical protein J1N35_025283 [Gossypium stocksii]
MECINLELNNTLIVLIPTVLDPKNFLQFWRISFCSILYKPVMKVIANWFKVVFPRIIGQEQIGFIVERNTTSNIIIAQEVIYSIKNKQKNRKWLVVKIDLEKAYDRVH